VRSFGLPELDSYVSRKTAPGIVREYILQVLVPDVVKRLYGVGMGLTRHPTPVVLPGGKHGPPRIEMVDMEAPVGVQVLALAKLIDKGVPGLKAGALGEAVPFRGVIVMGSLEGLDEARRQAERHRAQEFSIGTGIDSLALTSGGGYRPPPGHQVTVIEDDFSALGPNGSSPHTNGRSDHAPPARSRKLTKAQQIAAKRRARKKR
jgi:hypothetical protein